MDIDINDYYLLGYFPGLRDRNNNISKTICKPIDGYELYLKKINNTIRNIEELNYTVNGILEHLNQKQ